MVVAVVAVLSTVLLSLAVVVAVAALPVLAVEAPRTVAMRPQPVLVPVRRLKAPTGVKAVTVVLPVSLDKQAVSVAIPLILVVQAVPLVLRW